MVTYSRLKIPGSVNLDSILTKGHRLQAVYYRTLRTLIDEGGKALYWVRCRRSEAQTLYEAGLILIKEEEDPSILSEIKREGSHRRLGYVYCQLLYSEFVLYLLEKYEHYQPVIED